MRRSALALVNKTTSTYDPTWGELMSQSFYDGDGNLFRRIENTYLSTVDLPGTFLHSIPRSQLTYDGLNNLIAASYSAYDGTPEGLGEGIDAKGQLRLTQTRTLTEGQGNQTIDTSFAYDTYGNLTSTRAYAAYGVLGTLPTPDNDHDRTSTTTYDSTYHAFPVTATNVLNQTSTTVYDFQKTGELPLGLAREVTDPNNATGKTLYDALGRSTESWQPGAAQANVKTIYPTVDAQGEIAAPYSIELQIWDDGGPGVDQYRKAWAFYDGMGRTLRTVGPAEDVGKYIQSDTWYDAQGQVGKAARPYEVTLATPPGSWSAPNWASLAVTTTAYDGFGRLTQVTAPDGAIVRTLYDGRLTTAIDPNGHKKASLQDDFGRLVEVREYRGTGTSTDPYSLYATTRYGYNTKGLLNSVIDAEENQTTITYNSLGQKVYMDDPDMGIWSYVYNAWGELVEQTDARGAQVGTQYDRLGRPALRQARMDDEDPWQTIATTTYDTATNGVGRPASTSSVFVDGSPTVVDTVSYDLLGRATSSTRTVDGVGYTSSSTYDSLGRNLTTTLATGEVLTTTYNARGLFEASGSSLGTYVSSTSYTATGGIDQQVLGNGVFNDFTYDETSNRLERIYTTRPGFLALVDLSYDYDLAGNISQIDDGVRQEERSYQYDFLDRLTFAGVHAGQQMIEERYYTYDQLGNLLSFRHRYPSAGNGRGVFAVGGSGSADGKASRGSFNGLSSSGMSSGAQGDYSGSALMPYVYGFGGDAPDGGYNGRGSLASGANGEGTSYQGAGSFNPMTGASEGSGFDGRGVLAFTRGIEGGFGGWEGQEYTGPYGETTIDYTYGDVNGEYPHAVTVRSNGDSFTYDAIGNMTSRTQGGVTWTQVFDAENRLVAVSDGTSTTTYVYDGGGGRLKRIVDDGATVTTTLYIGNMEIEKVGSTESKRTVYYGGAFRVIGGENPGLYFLHSDYLGSTSVISDANGLKVAGSDVVYAPFGEVRAGNESDLTDFGYTGQRHDDSSGGLMYYGARYYLPGIQHFISADTVMPGVTSQALNRYSYVVNNPIKLVDPTGHRYSGPGAYNSPSPKPTAKPAARKPSPPGRPLGTTNGSGGGAIAQAMTQKSNTGCTSIASCQKTLERFDVVVDFDKTNTISEDDQLKALKVIWEAVGALSRLAADAVSAYYKLPTGIGMSAQEAFKALFGPTHISITSNGSTSKGYYGQNNGFNKGTGAFEIDFALSKVLGTSGTSTMIGVGLVAHEIGHNITLGDGASDPHSFNQYLSDNKPTIDDRAVAPSTLYEKENGIPKYLTWNPGHHGPDWYAPYEVSADIIANLALDGFRNDRIGDHAWNWWVSNVGTFMYNTARCVDGTHTCLP